MLAHGGSQGPEIFATRYDPAVLAVLLLCPVVLAGVLLASAVGKFRHPDTVAGWAAMGVPRILQRRTLVTAHPWGELVLAAALLLIGGWLSIVVTAAALLLMAAYLALVVRALGRPEPSCACFGAPTPVTPLTVGRNALLVVVAALATVGAVGQSEASPTLGGPLAALVTGAPAVLVGAALTAAIVVLVMRSSAPIEVSATSAAALPPAPDEELGDYVRTRTPAVQVQLADGRTTNLRALSSVRPLMLFEVSETCASCRPVIEAVPRWRALLPEVDLRLLLRPEPGDTALTERQEPQSLHDPTGLVRASIADWPTPTAVLFGIDGMLAGGPESGYAAIEAFIAEVDASLHGAPSL